MPFMDKTIRVGSLLAGLAAIGLAAAILPPALAVSDDATCDCVTEPQRVLVEIYRIAPGRHEAFLQDIASYDEANERAGLPPRQLYVHSDGANWDFMLIQPASTPDDKRDALNAAWEELDLPSGAKFFITFRENITEHSDTFAWGPTSAGAVLDSLEE